MQTQTLIELYISLVVVGLQAYFFFIAREQVSELKSYFPNRQLGNEDMTSFSENDSEVQIIKQIDYNVDQEFYEIVDMINKYLIKNRGSVDFKIVENIVNRAVDSRTSSLQPAITLPLYIGLMGTFVGIIAGLFFIVSGGGVNDDTIQPFITGVIIAMSASFCGLLATVWNTHHYRKSKVTLDSGRNGFFNFLQVELLPHMGNSLYDSLEKLKLNINEFNNKFSKNIGLFDKTFSVNIISLRDAVGSLSANINPIIENTKTQRQFLDELRNIGYTRMADANVRVFQIMKEAGPNFVAFIQKQKELNESMTNTATVVNTIMSVMDRVKGFEDAINNLGEKVSASEVLSSGVMSRIDKKLNYLENQFELLEQHSKISTTTISDFFEKEIEKINELSEKIKRTLENSLDFNVSENPLQKLRLLDSLNENLLVIREKLENTESHSAPVVIQTDFQKEPEKEWNKVPTLVTPLDQISTPIVENKKAGLKNRIINFFNRNGNK